MKRKIAAIFAADIAGYSRLVAEDEEETLRRLASYRQVTDDFIARYGGRIFNTAGDAVLAEFPSAVEAVRCAIDIQESLRTRNMAYPVSRQMSFRIGITIGDVVERDGDLLGDGVNIAARLEGLAEVGGICISRAVHEQVANKLSVQFADIGAQEVKNIPTPVHAYMVAMRREDGTFAMPQIKKPLPPRACGRSELDVAFGGDGRVSRRHRRRGLPVFHQAGIAQRTEGSLGRHQTGASNLRFNAGDRRDDGCTAAVDIAG
jgi:class 3 adenylate cyclase